MQQRKPLMAVLRTMRPDVDIGAIAAGRVQVDGAIVTNPGSMVLPSARIVVTPARLLKGEAKLRLGLGALGLGAVTLDGRVALDVGASSGGFTKELLRRGARRVYAVDAGFGQLLGSLRQDRRVVNLEQTNASKLTTELVPEAVDVMTVDVSYSPLRSIVARVSRALGFAADARLVALVKPMFELQAAELPTSAADLDRAVRLAESAIADAGWSVRTTVRSPLAGNHGAVEFFTLADLGSLPNQPSLRDWSRRIR